MKPRIRPSLSLFSSRVLLLFCSIIFVTASSYYFFVEAACPNAMTSQTVTGASGTVSYSAFSNCDFIFKDSTIQSLQFTGTISTASLTFENVECSGTANLFCIKFTASLSAMRNISFTNIRRTFSFPAATGDVILIHFAASVALTTGYSFVARSLSFSGTATQSGAMSAYVISTPPVSWSAETIIIEDVTARNMNLRSTGSICTFGVIYHAGPINSCKTFSVKNLKIENSQFQADVSYCAAAHFTPSSSHAITGASTTGSFLFFSNFYIENSVVYSVNNHATIHGTYIQGVISGFEKVTFDRFIAIGNENKALQICNLFGYSFTASISGMGPANTASTLTVTDCTIYNHTLTILDGSSAGAAVPFSLTPTLQNFYSATFRNISNKFQYNPASYANILPISVSTVSSVTHLSFVDIQIFNSSIAAAGTSQATLINVGTLNSAVSTLTITGGGMFNVRARTASSAFDLAVIRITSSTPANLVMKISDVNISLPTCTPNSLPASVVMNLYKVSVANNNQTYVIQNSNLQLDSTCAAKCTKSSCSVIWFNSLLSLSNIKLNISNSSISQKDSSLSQFSFIAAVNTAFAVVVDSLNVNLQDNFVTSRGDIFGMLPTPGTTPFDFRNASWNLYCNNWTGGHEGRLVKAFSTSINGGRIKRFCATHTATPTRSFSLSDGNFSTSATLSKNTSTLSDSNSFSSSQTVSASYSKSSSQSFSATAYSPTFSSTINESRSTSAFTESFSSSRHRNSTTVSPTESEKSHSDSSNASSLTGELTNTVQPSKTKSLTTASKSETKEKTVAPLPPPKPFEPALEPKIKQVPDIILTSSTMITSILGGVNTHANLAMRHAVLISMSNCGQEQKEIEISRNPTRMTVG